MSVISQELLDKLNKRRPGPGADPTELDKFNIEYNAVLAEMEKKKKKAEEDKEDNQDASHIPGPRPDSEFKDDGDEASHIPD